MPRTRSIKPDFNDNDDIAALSPWARLLYIGLWGHVDGQGLIEESPRSIRSKVFPREDHQVSSLEAWLDELLKPGSSGRPRLIRIEWRGKKLLYCPTLPNHSRVFDDEAQNFEVPEDLLARARDQFGIVLKGEKPRKDPPNRPPTLSADNAQVPRGSHEEPANNPRGTRECSTTPTSSSASAPTSASAPASASTRSAVRVIPRCAGDNSGSEAESGNGQMASGGNGENCQYCKGTGRVSAIPPGEEFDRDYRCSCKLGQKSGSQSWPKWNPALAKDYTIVAEPGAG